MILQIIQTTDSLVVSLPSHDPAYQITLWDMIQRGGIIMVPIGVLSVITIYIFIERFLSIKRASAEQGNFMANIRELMHQGKIEAALSICKNSHLPASRMIEEGIKRIGIPIKEIKESIEIVGKFEVYTLEKNLPVLAIIAGIAPMFGFLGTIVGVIKIFYDISLTSDVSIGTVSAGLYTKMISSSAGLIVGILSFVCYHWLNLMIGRVVNGMEKNAMEFINILREPQK